MIEVKGYVSGMIKRHKSFMKVATRASCEEDKQTSGQLRACSANALKS